MVANLYASVCMIDPRTCTSRIFNRTCTPLNFSYIYSIQYCLRRSTWNRGKKYHQLQDSKMVGKYAHISTMHLSCIYVFIVLISKSSFHNYIAGISPSHLQVGHPSLFSRYPLGQTFVHRESGQRCSVTVKMLDILTTMLITIYKK